MPVIQALGEVKTEGQKFKVILSLEASLSCLRLGQEKSRERGGGVAEMKLSVLKRKVQHASEP